MLVAAGASLTMRDANGLTPMMIAFQVEDNDLATYLESEFLFITNFVRSLSVIAGICCANQLFIYAEQCLFQYLHYESESVIDFD